MKDLQKKSQVKQQIILKLETNAAKLLFNNTDIILKNIEGNIIACKNEADVFLGIIPIKAAIKSWKLDDTILKLTI